MNTAHSEIWTIDDLIEYAKSQGYNIEITNLKLGIIDPSKPLEYYNEEKANKWISDKGVQS